MGDKMKDAPTELQQFSDNSKKPFSRFHKKHLGASESEFRASLERFSTARMDLPRTNSSIDVARHALQIIGLSDFGDFRDFVLRREESRKMSYVAQRDHSAHTVNNYLLGWYFWGNCSAMQLALGLEFQKRGVGHRGAVFPFDSGDSFFGCLWPYVSLLHDNFTRWPSLI
jgi:hypothetical protein